MPDVPLSPENRALIETHKRRYWTQPGIGAEYHALALARQPRTRLKNILDLSIVQRYLAGRRILDAGAGTGRFSLPLVQAGLSVVSLDISREMLGVAAREAAGRGGRLQTAQGDLAHLPFPDDTFDTVISMTVLRHFPEWRGLLAECLRVTRPGGRVIFDLASGEQHVWRESLGQPEWSPSHALKAVENFEATATLDELADLAEQWGITLVAAWPSDLLVDNPLIAYALGDMADEFLSAMDALVGSAEAIELCEYVARVALSKLSPAIAPTTMVVIEKRAARARYQKPFRRANPPSDGISSLGYVAALLEAVLAPEEWEAFTQWAAAKRSDPMVELVTGRLLPHIPPAVFTWPD